MAGKSSGDLVVEILKGIRQEVRATNQRLDQTNERLDRMEHRQTESEMRLATELVNVATAVNAVRDLLRENLSVRDRVEDHERRLADIERRLPA
jgi:hypothetical protein